MCLLITAKEQKLNMIHENLKGRVAVVTGGGAKGGTIGNATQSAFKVALKI